MRWWRAGVPLCCCRHALGHTHRERAGEGEEGGEEEAGRTQHTHNTVPAAPWQRGHHAFSIFATERKVMLELWSGGVFFMPPTRFWDGVSFFCMVAGSWSASNAWMGRKLSWVNHHYKSWEAFFSQKELVPLRHWPWPTASLAKVQLGNIVESLFSFRGRILLRNIQPLSFNSCNECFIKNVMYSLQLCHLNWWP